MTTTAGLIAAIREAAAGTRYVVQETPDGFDLTIDVPLPWWRTPGRQVLENALTHVVRIDEARHELTITDQTNTVTWHRWSFPRIRTSWSRGRLSQKQFRRTWRRDETTGKRELVEEGVELTA